MPKPREPPARRPGGCSRVICCRPRAGYVFTQATLLFPAVVVAEATLSFVGLGLPDTVPSWGTALQETANVAALAAFPWILLPALGVFLVTWASNTLTTADDG